MFINVATSGHRNVIKKEAEKILKYKNPIKEIQRMWNVQAKVIPVIIGATGTISKSLRQYLSSITGRHEFNKNIHIGHSTYTTESVDVKVQNTFQGQNNIIRECSTNCKYRTASKLKH